MTPYSRPKLSDLYTLSQSKLLENHTLHSDTYLYNPYMAVPPPPPRGYSISLMRDPARGTSQLYLRVSWKCAFKQFFLSGWCQYQLKFRREQHGSLRLFWRFCGLSNNVCHKYPKQDGNKRIEIEFRALYTAISRKVVGKNVHVTIPKGNMGYDQYTVPDVCSCRTYFCCFPLALENTFSWPFVPILSTFFEERRTQNHPQCLLGLLRALFPTTFLETAVYNGDKASGQNL